MSACAHVCACVWARVCMCSCVCVCMRAHPRACVNSVCGKAGRHQFQSGKTFGKKMLFMSRRLDGTREARGLFYW